MSRDRAPRRRLTAVGAVMSAALLGLPACAHDAPEDDLLDAMRTSPAVVVPPGAHEESHIERVHDESLALFGRPGPASISVTYKTSWGAEQLFRWYHAQLLPDSWDVAWVGADQEKRFGFLGLNAFSRTEQRSVLHLEMHPGSGSGTRVSLRLVRDTTAAPSQRPPSSAPKSLRTVS